MGEAVWYWWEGTTQHGPITWEKLQSLAESGKISPSDWVMREGWPDRKLACEAADSSVNMAEVGRPPEPPPLPLPPLPQEAALPPLGVVAPSVQVDVAMPVTLAPVAEVGSAALPMPLLLPPLAPEQTLLDSAAAPAPSEGGAEGDVLELRRALCDERQPTERPGWQVNLPAILALAASVTGLMFLAFEMGVVGLGLGGWCLYASSETGNNSGKNLALTAVIIGAFNVGFRVLCATVDLGLVM
jgi:hypothetical protein